MELTIGYHLLEGKMVDLKKPFAILEKQSTPVDVDAMEEDGVVQCNTEYKVCSQNPLPVCSALSLLADTGLCAMLTHSSCDQMHVCRRTVHCQHNFSHASLPFQRLRRTCTAGT